jgi:hypothetical protein
VSLASAKHLEKTLAGAVIAAARVPALAVVYAAWMERHGPAFVLMGATPAELAEWKRCVRWLRVVVGGQPEEVRVVSVSPLPGSKGEHDAA